MWSGKKKVFSFCDEMLFDVRWCIMKNEIKQDKENGKRRKEVEREITRTQQNTTKQNRCRKRGGTIRERGIRSAVNGRIRIIAAISSLLTVLQYSHHCFHCRYRNPTRSLRYTQHIRYCWP